MESEHLLYFKKNSKEILRKDHTYLTNERKMIEEKSSIVNRYCILEIRNVGMFNEVEFI